MQYAAEGLVFTLRGRDRGVETALFVPRIYWNPPKTKWNPKSTFPKNPIESQAIILCFFRIQPEATWNLKENKQNPSRFQIES